jgi:hypothetical protein
MSRYKRSLTLRSAARESRPQSLEVIRHGVREHAKSRNQQVRVRDDVEVELASVGHDSDVTRDTALNDADLAYVQDLCTSMNPRRRCPSGTSTPRSPPL